MRVYSKIFYKLKQYYSSLIKNRENSLLWNLVQADAIKLVFTQEPLIKYIAIHAILLCVGAST